jgi:O-antigen/teichoic acid export membrane protein
VYSIKNISRKFSTFFLFEILNKVFPFILLPIVTSNIPVAQFGDLGVFNALAYFFIVFISLNHYTFLAKEYYKVEINGDYLFYNLLVQNLVTGICVFILSIITFYFFVDIFRFSMIIYALIAAFVSSMNSLISTYFVTKKKPFIYGFLSILPNIVLLISVYLFFEVYKLNYSGRIFAQILSGIIGLILGFVLIYKSVKPFFNKVDLPLIKRSLLWTLPLLPHTLGFWAKSGLDTIFIDKYFGNEYAGFYSILLIYSSLWMVLINSLFNVITPEYNSLMHSRPLLSSEYRRWGFRFAILILFLLGLFYFASVFFTRILLPINYLVSLNYLLYTLPALFFNYIYAYLSLNYFFTDRTKYLGKVSVFTSILHIILVYVFSKSSYFSLVVFVQSISSFIMVLILLFNLNKIVYVKTKN